MTDLDQSSAADFLADHGQRLIEVRRDLHAHPELGRTEHRTTELVAEALRHVGLSPQVLPAGTGLICDIGPTTPRIALRADLDALPIPDTKDVSYRSTVEGVAHACGHDVHTTVVLGAGLVLQRLALRGELAQGVRLIFQPAEELLPGGALDVIEARGLAGIGRIFAVHCDPSIDAGTIGLRTGPITAASDHVEVRLTGPGGHTARPHLSADLVSALGAIASQSPGLVARRVDPRAGTTLVWGQIRAGSAANVIPRAGVLRGTLRTLFRDAWDTMPAIVEGVLRQIAAPYRVEIEVDYTRGVPPVVNDGDCIARLRAAIESGLPGVAVSEAQQSMGGEDFAWYLDQVPGALARLGVRTPGAAKSVDLHQSEFDVDERCIPIGVSLMTQVALAAD